jgi:hypothetical protein
MSTTVNNNYGSNCACSNDQAQVPEAFLAMMQFLDGLSKLSQLAAKNENDADAEASNATCSTAANAALKGDAREDEDACTDDDGGCEGANASSCGGTASPSLVNRSAGSYNLAGTPSTSSRNPLTRQPIDKTADPDWTGDRAEGVGALTVSVEDFKAQMYAQVDQELDAVLGQGQYDKPQNHYQYVQRVSEAMKQLDPVQQKAMKNRLEQIGQPLHTNFGLTRTRNDSGYLYGVALNSYANNGFSGAQSVGKKQLKATFEQQRDEALGRR